MRNRCLAIALLAASMAGCQDLDIVNNNAPDRRRALSSPSDVETLIVSAWRDLWNRWLNDDDTYNTIPVVADLFTATYANDAALELSNEPRVPFNNNPLAEGHDVTRFYWEGLYKGISSANDGLFAISGGLRIETGSPVADHTSRAWAFGKFLQGLAHGYLALLHDKNFVVHETRDIADPTTVPLVEYPASMDSAIAYMEVAIDSLSASTFSLPDTWINGQLLTGAELARIAHSYIARLMVYGTRTPEQRRNLDWDRVLFHLDRGITQNHMVLLASGVLTSGYLSRLQQNGTFSSWGDYKFIGPADVSGAYKAWLDLPIPQRNRIQLTTPDRRITGATPTSNGTYFRYRADNIFRPERGTYHHSHYQWYRNSGRTNSQTYAILTVDEMNLLRAEAYYYKNDLQRAADLINTTRTRSQTIGSTTYPGLPAVTTAGVPQSATCVPRMDGVTCGTLIQALMYERLLEISGLDAVIGYADSRGWGRLPTGTFLHLPIPGRELEALGLQNYTFGGVGGPGAAQ